MLPHDLRVEGALQKLHLSYHIDDDGDFVLDWRLHGDRTQSIWIGSRTHLLGPLELREVWSIVAYFPYIPSEKISRTLKIPSSKSVASVTKSATTAPIS